MDMNVKLNHSYPAARSAEKAGDKLSAPLNQASGDREKVDLSSAQDPGKVNSAVSVIEQYLNSTRRNLQFSTDEESGKIVVKVIATDTGELIRQLPSEEALRIANNLNDVNSLLFDAKV